MFCLSAWETVRKCSQTPSGVTFLGSLDISWMWSSSCLAGTIIVMPWQNSPRFSGNFYTAPSFTKWTLKEAKYKRVSCREHLSRIVPNTKLISLYTSKTRQNHTLSIWQQTQKNEFLYGFHIDWTENCFDYKLESSNVAKVFDFSIRTI